MNNLIVIANEENKDEMVERAQMQYKTRKVMGEAYDERIARQILIQTLEEYQYALSASVPDSPIGRKQKANLLIPNDEYNAKNKTILNLSRIRDEYDMADITVPWQSVARDKAELLEYDLIRCRMLYSVMFGQIGDKLLNMTYDELTKLDDDFLSGTITMSARKLLQAMGSQRPNEDELTEALDKLGSMERIHGRLRVDGTDMLYKLVVGMWHDPTHGTIAFAMPYGRALARELAKEYVKNIEQQKEKNVKHITPKPIHSDLISGKICKEKNKKAIDIVVEIVKLIERTGPKGVPNISVREIVMRNPYLSYDFERMDRHSFSTNLQRAFSKAREMLDKYTRLREKYKNLQIPDMDHIGIRDMDKNNPTILKFKHGGLTKKKNDAIK